MVVENFTPASALVGGVLIGVAATLLLALKGRIAGVSSIVGSLFDPVPADVAWRMLAGMALFRAGNRKTPLTSVNVQQT